MLAAAVLVGFLWLAVACVAFLGPLGMVPWLICYGLFLAVAKWIRAIAAEPEDAFTPHP